jgi:hypothetical protein
MRGDRKARLQSSSEMLRYTYPALSCFVPGKIVPRFDYDKGSLIVRGSVDGFRPDKSAGIASCHA